MFILLKWINYFVLKTINMSRYHINKIQLKYFIKNFIMLIYDAEVNINKKLRN